MTSVTGVQLQVLPFPPRPNPTYFNFLPILLYLFPSRLPAGVTTYIQVGDLSERCQFP